MCSLMNVPIDSETLRICSQLLSEGANPEALAALVAELETESSRK